MEVIRMNIKNNKNCKITINDEGIAVSEKEKIADELFEALTLIQTHKLHEQIPIVLFGEEYWKNLVNWDYLVETGMINADDLKIFHMTSDIGDAYAYVTQTLEKYSKTPSATGVHSFGMLK